VSRISSVTKPERSSERKEVYNSGLLAWLGCHTDAYEQAKWFGDDLAVKADGFLVADPGPAWMLSRLGAGRPPLERARLGVAFVGAVRRGAVIDLMSHWLAADGLARRLGLSDDVRRSLRDGYKRWDGKGAIGARGEEIRWAVLLEEPLACRQPRLAQPFPPSPEPALPYRGKLPRPGAFACLPVTRAG
jgi:hypothetical protein